MNKRLRLLSPNSRNARLFLVGLVLLAAAILAFFYWLSRQNQRVPDLDEGLAQAARAEQIKILNQDSDGDGLKDWEETIFRTDPNSADSDGDGTPDGEEVAQVRDPLKPGPNDAIATTTPAEASEDFTNAPNLTERIAQVLGQRYITQRVLDPSAKLNPKAISQQIAREIPEYKPVSPPLTLKGLAVIEDNSEAAIKTWATQFDTTVLDSLRGIDQAAPLILVTAFQNDNYAVLAQLDNYVAGYERLAERLKKIPVPSQLAAYELDFIRALFQFKDLAVLFRRAEQDPVAALAGVQPFFDLAKSLEELNKRLRQDLIRRGITFS